MKTKAGWGRDKTTWISDKSGWITGFGEGILASLGDKGGLG